MKRLVAACAIWLLPALAIAARQGSHVMNVVKCSTRAVLPCVLGVTLLASAFASAQSLAGVVKDTSGAVVPGPRSSVTVDRVR